MSLLDRVTLRDLTPSRLWSLLDPATKRAAAQAVYSRGAPEETGRLEADTAIATTLRFRPQALRKLPMEKRVGYLIKAVRVDDSLAATLLLSLHLGTRRAMLRSFLDRLGIPHEDGVIRTDEFRPPEPAKIGPAVEALYESYPAEDVDVYLATLIAMEPDSWGAVIDILQRRRT